MLAELNLEPFRDFWDQIVESVPDILQFLLIVVVGLLFAFVAGRVVRGIARSSGLEARLEQIGSGQLLYRIGYRRGSATLVGSIVFWMIALVTTIAALDSIGATSIADGFRAMVAFIPRLVAAGVFLLVGLWGADMVRKLVVGLTGEKSALEAPGLVANILYYVVTAVTIALALDQLGLATDIVNGIIQVLIGCAAFGLALSMAFGSKETMSNVIARTYIARQYQAGDVVQLEDGRSGVVKAHSPITMVLRVDGGELTVPYTRVLREVIRVEPVDAGGIGGDSTDS